MKLNLWLITMVIAVGAITTSCSDSKIEQGEVQYELTYPYMELDGWIAIMIPDEMTIIFKGSKMRTTIKKGKIFETNIISDESNNYLAMYSILDGKEVYCELTADEIASLKESMPKYTFNKTTEQDSVGGAFCTKYEVSSSDTLAPYDAWFTEDFRPQKAAWFSSYGEITGFPMVYDIERYGIFTHAEAVSFVEREIKDEDFEVEGDYEKISFEEYEKESLALFEVIREW